MTPLLFAPSRLHFALLVTTLWPRPIRSTLPLAHGLIIQQPLLLPPAHQEKPASISSMPTPNPAARPRRTLLDFWGLPSRTTTPSHSNLSSSPLHHDGRGEHRKSRRKRLLRTEPATGPERTLISALAPAFGPFGRTSIAALPISAATGTSRPPLINAVAP
jgi:hypothetical protein